MKKLMSLLLVLVMIAGLAGCGQKPAETTTAGGNAGTTTTAAEAPEEDA